MIRRFLLGLMALLLAAPLAAAPGVDWSKVAVRKLDGSFVQGNPNAKVKLVEYLSFTCPHCAHFEHEAIGPLTAKYIRTGLVSYEVRHAVRDAYDLTATLLARCSGPGPFFAVAPVVMATQDQWLGQAQRWLETKPALDGLPPEKMLPKMAAGSGLAKIFLARGLKPARAQACLTGAADREAVTAQADQAWNMPGFPGTPTFSVNGQMLGSLSGWSELDTALAKALK